MVVATVLGEEPVASEFRAQDADRAPLVGMACYAASWMALGCYELTWVNVVPVRQGRGVGQQLVNKCLAEVKAVADVVMLTTSKPDYYRRFWNFQTIWERGEDVYMSSKCLNRAA